MKVRIFKPSKSAMQSGRAKTNKWCLEFVTLSPRVPESLMGWSSSNDTANQVKLKFDTVEDAISYAEKNGWEYDVIQEQQRVVRPRNYSDNFVYKQVEE